MRTPLFSTPLVEAEWLLANLQRVVLLDCRFSLADAEAGRRAYQNGHIPGAIYADLARDLSAPVQAGGRGGRHPLPDPATLAAWLGQAGIGRQTPVVAYDDTAGGQGFYAARAWWLLRWLGHAEVAVLNGGLGAYIKAGGTLSQVEPQPEAQTFTPDVQHDMLAVADDVAARAADTALIDARAPERYRGDTEPMDKKAGHIPGARNLNWAQVLDAQGRFLPPAQQCERLDLDDATPSIMYCGSGVSATPNVLARELAGVPAGKNNRLYAGSWSDWVSDDSRPVATGGE